LDGQVAKWNNGAGTWDCADDTSGGGGSVTVLANNKDYSLPTTVPANTCDLIVIDGVLSGRRSGAVGGNGHLYLIFSLNGNSLDSQIINFTGRRTGASGHGWYFGGTNTRRIYIEETGIDQTITASIDNLNYQDIGANYSVLCYSSGGGGGSGLPGGCLDGQVAKWNNGAGTWDCADDTSGGASGPGGQIYERSCGWVTGDLFSGAPYPGNCVPPNCYGSDIDLGVSTESTGIAVHAGWQQGTGNDVRKCLRVDPENIYKLSCSWYGAAIGNCVPPACKAGDTDLGTNTKYEDEDSTPGTQLFTGQVIRDCASASGGGGSGSGGFSFVTPASSQIRSLADGNLIANTWTTLNLPAEVPNTDVVLLLKAFSPVQNRRLHAKPLGAPEDWAAANFAHAANSIHGSGTAIVPTNNGQVEVYSMAFNNAWDIYVVGYWEEGGGSGFPTCSNPNEIVEWDGSAWQCIPTPSGGGDITDVNGGDGLTPNSCASGACTLAVNPGAAATTGIEVVSDEVRLMDDGCVAGEVLKRNAANNGWECVAAERPHYSTNSNVMAPATIIQMAANLGPGGSLDTAEDAMSDADWITVATNLGPGGALHMMDTSVTDATWISIANALGPGGHLEMHDTSVTDATWISIAQGLGPGGSLVMYDTSLSAGTPEAIALGLKNG
jgi:hypothetical protein